MKIGRRRISQFLALGGTSMFFSRGACAEYLPACIAMYRAKSKTIDVDVHCHAFNGSDLQISSFIKKLYLVEFEGDERKLLENVADVVQWAVWRGAPSGESERGRLERFGSEASADRLDSLVREDEQRSRDLYARHFSDALRRNDGRDFLKLYLDYIHSRVEADPAIRWWMDAKDRKSELEILSDPKGLLRQLDFEEKNDVFQLFTFIKTFFNYRYLNVHYLLRNYGCDQGTVQLVAPALVDFDYGLGNGGSPPPTTLHEQCLVMERIAEVFGGRVFTYLPYDPWRHAVEGPKVFRMALDFIKRGSAVGFKLYPPMGFAPIDNSQVHPRPKEWPSDPNFPKKLDGALLEFWDEVAKWDIPVIAHANASNQAAPAFQRLGSPGNWGKLLSNKRYERLRICFGHFGGQALLSAAPETWPLDFLKLALKFEHVYGDISFFDDILLTRSGQELQDRLSNFFKFAGAVETKTIYGSDWSMIAVKARSNTYFKRFDIALRKYSKFSKTARDNVMALNAARYLGLNKGSATRNRLEGFYSARKVQADWPAKIS